MNKYVNRLTALCQPSATNRRWTGQLRPAVAMKCRVRIDKNKPHLHTTTLKSYQQNAEKQVTENISVSHTEKQEADCHWYHVCVGGSPPGWDRGPWWGRDMEFLGAMMEKVTSLMPYIGLCIYYVHMGLSAIFCVPESCTLHNKNVQKWEKGPISAPGGALCIFSVS